MTRAAEAIEAIATHAQDGATKLPRTDADPFSDFYKYGDNHHVMIDSCTQAITVMFNNLWAYYAPGRKVLFMEGDEDLLVEVSRSLDEGSFSLN